MIRGAKEKTSYCLDKYRPEAAIPASLVVAVVGTFQCAHTN